MGLMSRSQFVWALLVPVSLIAAACSDDESPGPGAGGTTAAGVSGSGGVSVSSGGASAATNGKAGSGSGGSGAGSAGKAGNGSGGSPASSGGKSSAGSSGSAGAAGTGRVVAARSDQCTPRCAVTPPLGFCALLDVGCDGSSACLLEAQCRPFEDCDQSVLTCMPEGNHSTCADAPNDDCQGGADCPGVCFCAQTIACPDGTSFNQDPGVCACVPIPTPTVTCGDIQCPPGFNCMQVLDSAACMKRFGQ